MASLFRNFSFDAPSPSLADHEAERALMNCSPSSQPTIPQHPIDRPPTPPACTIGDLAQLLGGQDLFVSTWRSQDMSTGPPTPPSEDESFPPTRPTYCRASASIMRMQRQAHSRLQCHSSQARDISKLVRMIEAEEQCKVNESTSCPASTCATVESGDEAIHLDYDCSSYVTEPSFSRPPVRAGDRRRDSVRVSKTIRMRKRSSTAAKDMTERRKTR